jgi:hypothetical protein
MFTHYKQVLGEFVFCLQKQEPVKWVTINIMTTFWKTALANLINFSNLWRPHPQTELHRWLLSAEILRFAP